MREMVVGDLFYLETSYSWNQWAIRSLAIDDPGSYWKYYLKHLAYDLGLG